MRDLVTDYLKTIEAFSGCLDEKVTIHWQSKKVPVTPPKDGENHFLYSGRYISLTKIVDVGTIEDDIVIDSEGNIPQVDFNGLAVGVGEQYKRRKDIVDRRLYINADEEIRKLLEALKQHNSFRISECEQTADRTAIFKPEELRGVGLDPAKTYKKENVKIPDNLEGYVLGLNTKYIKKLSG